MTVDQTLIRIARLARQGNTRLAGWLREAVAQQLRLPIEDQAKLGLTRTNHDGKRFVTGKPVVFHARPTNAFRRSKYAPKGQFAEVVKEGDEGAVEVAFRRPLILKRGKRGNSKTNWRMRLFDIFRKRGARLTRAMYKRWKVDGIVLVHRRRPIAAIDLAEALDAAVQADLKQQRALTRDKALGQEAAENLEEAQTAAQEAQDRLDRAQNHFVELDRKATEITDGSDWRAFLPFDTVEKFQKDNEPYEEEEIDMVSRAADGVPRDQIAEDLRSLSQPEFQQKYPDIPISRVSSYYSLMAFNDRAAQIVPLVQRAGAMEKVVERLKEERDEAQRKASEYERLAQKYYDPNQSVRQASAEEFERLYGAQMLGVDFYSLSGEETARKTKEALFGDPDITDEQVAALAGIAGWPGDNSVSISYEAPRETYYGTAPPKITLSGSGTYIKEMSRVVKFDDQGNLSIRNAHLKKSDEAPRGIGIKSFYSQILAARSLGVEKVGCHAFREDPEMSEVDWEWKRERFEEERYEQGIKVERAQEDLEEAQEVVEETRAAMREAAAPLNDLAEDIEGVDAASDFQPRIRDLERRAEDAEDRARDIIDAAYPGEHDLYPPETDGHIRDMPADRFIDPEEKPISYRRLEKNLRLSRQAWQQLQEIRGGGTGELVAAFEEARERFKEAEEEARDFKWELEEEQEVLKDIEDTLEDLGEVPPMGYIGYRVWPRFGYSVDLLEVEPFKYSPWWIEELIYDGFLDEKYNEDGEIDYAAYTMHDLFETEAGREWWYANGDSFEAEFLTLPGDDGREPRHFQVLSAYIEERARREGTDIEGLLKRARALTSGNGWYFF